MSTDIHCGRLVYELALLMMITGTTDIRGRHLALQPNSYLRCYLLSNHYIIFHPHLDVIATTREKVLKKRLIPFPWYSKIAVLCSERTKCRYGVMILMIAFAEK